MEETNERTKENGGGAKTSSLGAVKASAADIGQKKEKQSKKSEKASKRNYYSNDENDPPTTSKSKFSKSAHVEKRHSSSTNVPAKNSLPAFAINKKEVERKSEIEQKQAKEIIEKKLEEKTQAEKQKCEEAEYEKKLALERAKELEKEENCKKVRKDLWGSFDKDDYEDAAEE
uniref:Uncharacterized protein n=1 Tax=Panagrolaimus sp. PS1159 TaxID=55785 RepID=A0AC35G7Z9_9BILA